MNVSIICFILILGKNLCYFNDLELKSLKSQSYQHDNDTFYIKKQEELLNSHISNFNGLSSTTSVDIDTSIKRNTQSLVNLKLDFSVYVDYEDLNVKHKNNLAVGIIKLIIDRVISTLQSIIKLKFPLGKKLSSYACFPDHIISKTSSSGVNQNFILFPTIVDNLNSNNDKNYNSNFFRMEICKTDSYGSYRPTVSVLYINNSKLNFSKTNYFDTYSLALLKEFLHILAFEKELLYNHIKTVTVKQQKSKNEYIYTFKAINEVIDTLYINEENKYYFAVKTPKVIEIAKKYYGCDSLINLNLYDHIENIKYRGHMHWHPRYLHGDLMSFSNKFDEAGLSDITLAFLEDTGWYSVTYYTGGLVKFGKNLGCKFLKNKCVENGVINFDINFCGQQISDDPEIINFNYDYIKSSKEIKEYALFQCSDTILHKSACSLNLRKDKIDKYNYFKNPRNGGLKSANYCPVKFQPYTMNFFDSGSCATGFQDFNLVKAYFRENFSEMSGCFETIYKDAISLTTDNKPVCYKFKCGTVELSIFVG